MESRQAVIEASNFTQVLKDIGGGELTEHSFSRIVTALYQDHHGRSQLREHLSNWEKFSSSFASRANAGILAGYCHYVLGHLDEAQEILAKEKRHAWGVYYYIRTLLDRHLFTEAVNAAEEASKKFDDFLPLAFLTIEVYCKSGWEEQVPKLLKQLESKWGKTPVYLYHQGLYQERVGEYPQAIASYRKTIDLDPQFCLANFRLGYCLDLYGRGDEWAIDQAIAAYENCLRIFPSYTNAVINLGLLYEDRERYHDAIKCFETVLKYHPEHPRARLFLGDARAATRMFYDKEEEKKADRQSQVLKIPVTDFELSVRSRNCLQKMNITTLGDLIMKTEQELLSYKNFGETSLKEIKDMLAQKGLRLGQGLEQGSPDAPASRNPLEATADPELLNRSIETLNLSVRSRRCMERLGVKTLRDLINKTEVQLMAAKNFGMTSLNEIKKKMAELGLRLRG
ncbi:MAG: tetratricopeptide repeat protein [Planctomycetes bacterium]|nr:tetratricopeptide repeat protein [Planctomycetota bacterium]